MELKSWLRSTLEGYQLEPIAVFRRANETDWPFSARNEDELLEKLERAGHFLPLPKEPASLANVVEVSLLDFLLEELEGLDGATARRGTERGYPDLEIDGDVFGGRAHALDIKVARRSASLNQTQSRITLYTGNTYFRYPTLEWPGTFRAFEDYESHLVLVAIYTFDPESLSHIQDVELVVEESWRIASKQRSSTTREYIGAVKSIDDLKSGNGEFESADAFYKFWRSFNFRIGRAVQQQLDKLLAEQRSAGQS